MGRVTKSKQLRIARNKVKINRRWHSHNERMMKQCVSSAVNEDNVCETVQEQNLFGECKDEDQTVGNNKPGKPTGFALYNSYNPQINIDSSNEEYILVDKKNLTNLLSIFPCKNCLQETLEVKLNNLKGYAHTLSVRCTNCDFESACQTSEQMSKKESTRGAFDVNRRVVNAFSSMGKGHRALELFSIGLNMKPLSFTSYAWHIYALHDYYRE